MITTRRLSKRYGKVTALADLDLEVAPGEVVGYLGPNGAGKTTYSKGNRQKLLLIAGLMTRAELLLLDEPTAGLDPLMERAFRHSIHEARARGQTVFLSSHILSEVEALCDRVAILRAGRLIEIGTLAQSRHLSALTVASSALGYASTYKTAVQRARYAALFGSNGGLAAIAGPARDIQSVAGYTVWKCSVFLTVVGAVWGLLTGTRLVRGEEEAGRWELLLAGQTTRRRAAVQAAAGLGAGLAVLWAITALITIAVGRSGQVHIAIGPALYFALTLVAGAATFLAAGALASQLAPSRHQAAGYAAPALGICYSPRMVADSDAGLTWLRWVTPLGWSKSFSRSPVPGRSPCCR